MKTPFPSQRNLCGDTLKRLSQGQHKPSHHQDTAPTQGEMAPEAGPSGERHTEPLEEKTAQSCLVSSQSAAGQRPPEQRCREGQVHLLLDRLQERNGPRLTYVKYSQEPWGKNRLPRDSQKERLGLGAPRGEGCSRDLKYVPTHLPLPSYML